MFRVNPENIDFEDELGAIVKAKVSVSASKKKPKKKSKAKAIFKKIGKAATVIATGGIAAAPMLAKSKKGKKVLSKLKGSKVAKAGKTLLSKAKALAGPLAKKAVSKAKPKAKKPAAKKPAAKKKPSLPPIAKAVQQMSASDCSNLDEMARLVAAKLMVTLGGPLTNANAILAKQELQNQATYEHHKLMSDAEFRRRVLELLTAKAARGNQTCKRTANLLRLR